MEATGLKFDRDFFFNKIYFLKTLDLQKKCDDGTESSHIPTPSLPLQTLYITMVCLLQLVNQYGYIIVSSYLIPIFSVFTHCPFPVPGSHPALHTTFWGHASLASRGCGSLSDVPYI